MIEARDNDDRFSHFILANQALILFSVARLQRSSQSIGALL